MKIHELKIKIDFCDAVLRGEKSFEIRENDKGFQKGDKIKFIPVDKYLIPTSHDLEGKEFEITYVLSGWGLDENYVVLAIKGRAS